MRRILKRVNIATRATGKRQIYLFLLLAILLPLLMAACGSNSTLASFKNFTGSCTLPTAQRVTYTIHQTDFQERTLNNGWSPDSKQIAFADPQDGRIKIYNTQLNKITTTLTPPMHASSPEWTTNGRIFFSSRPDGAGAGPASNASHHTPPNLYVMSANGSDLQQISIATNFPSGPQTIYWDSTTPAKVSPDGKHIAFSTIQHVSIQNNRLVSGNWIMLLGDVVSVNGHLQLQNMRPLNRPDTFWYEAKGFTRDGKQLLFASNRGNGQGNPNVNPDVYTMNLATGAITRYTHNPAWEETMDITANNQFVVFNSDRANLSLGPSQIAPSHDNASSFLKVLTAKTAHHDLYLAGPQGDAGWTCRLTFDGNPDNGGWAATQPRWSPDGHSIRFQENKGKMGRTLLLTFSNLPASFQGNRPLPTLTTASSTSSLPRHLYSPQNRENKGTIFP